MDARVGNVAVAHGGELLAQVGAVLVLDVLDNRVPAVVVVHLVAVAGRVDDVQPQLDAVLDDDCAAVSVICACGRCVDKTSLAVHDMSSREERSEHVAHEPDSSQQLQRNLSL